MAVARWLNRACLIVVFSAGSFTAYPTEGIDGTDETREFAIAAFDRLFVSGGATRDEHPIESTNGEFSILVSARDVAAIDRAGT